MSFKHSRDEVRLAKDAASDRFRDDGDVTSVGIGLTEDKSDYAVTVTVASHDALEKLPVTIGTVQVRAMVSGGMRKLEI